jgi:diaminopimelate epimerase
MKLHFYKYQGTGNDFIILDNRKGQYANLPKNTIARLCDRRFGIGADGLMLLNNAKGYDFGMTYYNANGLEGSMCGNGGRCLVKFAAEMGIHSETYVFTAIDGEHLAEITETGTVRLKMKDVEGVQEEDGDFVLDTGSPHYVKFVGEIQDMDVHKKGMEIRYSSTFAKQGINVNFVEQQGHDAIFVRTYERGVEDETLSCGTGVTAAALVSFHNEIGFNNVVVHTRGGRLEVEFERNPDHSFSQIWLSGPAEKVFEGTVITE